MTDDEFWRERLNRLDRGLGHAPRGVFPGDRLAYVTSRPADEKRFYRAYTTTILGPEVEGGEAQIEADVTGEMLVYPVARNPKVGDHVVVSGVLYRHVSEGAGTGPSLPRTLCLTYTDCRGAVIGGCLMPGLSVTVTGPGDQEYSGVTDANGRVCFTVDGDGSYTAVSEASGYWQGLTTTHEVTGDLDVIVVLQPVSGRVCSICNGECPDPYPLPSTLNFTAWNTFTVLDTDPESPTFGQFIQIFRSVSGTATWGTYLLGQGHGGGVLAGWGDPEHPGFAGRSFLLHSGGATVSFIDAGTGTVQFMDANSISCRPYAASFGDPGSGFSFSE